jgi:hypothetical protein
MRVDENADYHTDARTAYLFQCGHSDTFAISVDHTGANLPIESCAQGWRLQREFPLGVHEPVPLPIDPEPVLRGIRAHGYFLWRNANTSKPQGTTQ